MLKHHLVRYTSDAGLFVSAERSVSGHFVVGVDPHAAGANSASDTQGAVDVSRPHGARQSVLTVVCHVDDFLLGLELNHNSDRPEDFFLGDTHLVVDVDKKRLQHKRAFFTARNGNALAANQHLGAFVFADFDVLQNLIELLFVYLRVHLRFHGHGITDAHGLERFG